MLFCCLLIFLNFFSKNSRNTTRVSNSLDPDQAQPFVGPDQCPTCLQKFSAANVTVYSIQDVGN